ncbi:MAG: hypothetical protein HQL48_06480 [Gammaproteobacteria bacterium]|nr:hypothetical protein [Gammaproteobacteria bacterium]
MEETPDIAEEVIEDNLNINDITEVEEEIAPAVIYTEGDTLLVSRSDVLKKLTQDTQIMVEYYPDYDNLEVKVVKGSVSLLSP